MIYSHELEVSTTQTSIIGNLSKYSRENSIMKEEDFSRNLDLASGRRLPDVIRNFQKLYVNNFYPQILWTMTPKCQESMTAILFLNFIFRANFFFPMLV